jgi:hypothetical protein
VLEAGGDQGNVEPGAQGQENVKDGLPSGGSR